MARASSVRIDSNIEQVVRQLQVRDPKLIARATVSGLNTAMTVAGKKAVAESALATGIAQKYIRARTKRTRASTRRLVAITRFNPRGLNPLTIGWSVAQADAYYRGPRAPGAKAFAATMPNGSRQVVVRLPSSQTSRPATGGPYIRRRYRLPIQSIRVFIGKKTIKEFNEALENEGVETFEKKVIEYLDERLAKGYRPRMRRLV